MDASEFKANRRDNVVFHYNTTKGASVSTMGISYEREVILAIGTRHVVGGKENKNDELHVYLVNEDLV